MESKGKKPIVRKHTDTHLECRCCGEMKLYSDFHNDKTGPFNKSYWCKECAKTNSRRHHKARIDRQDIEYIRAKRSVEYKRKYGISLEDKERLLESQNSKCKICSKELVPYGQHTHVDHCHATGKIRGILCTNCNRGLGHFQDNVMNLQSAINYLNSHTEDGTQKEGTCL